MGGACSADRPASSPVTREAAARAHHEYQRRLEQPATAASAASAAEQIVPGDDVPADCRKVLLLGAGESGKSTLFKQIQVLHGCGFSDTDMNTFRHNVHLNVIESMQILIRGSQQFGGMCSVEARHEVAAESVLGVKVAYEGPPDPSRPLLTSEVARSIRTLWEDSGIRQTHSRKRELVELPDSAAYYFERMSEVDITSPDYDPSMDDVLRTRVRSTGIVQTPFELCDEKFVLVDVGGQKNERKKWIHCFENVDVLLYMVAVSEYDQNMFEASSCNRMDDAMELFAQIINSRWFRDTTVFLVLNKRDLLEQKMRTSPLREYYPEYSGSTDVNDALRFFCDKFVRLNRQGVDINVYTTTATESRAVRQVMSKLGQKVVSTARLYDRRLARHNEDGKHHRASSYGSALRSARDRGGPGRYSVAHPTQQAQQGSGHATFGHRERKSKSKSGKKGRRKPRSAHGGPTSSRRAAAGSSSRSAMGGAPRASSRHSYDHDHDGGGGYGGAGGSGSYSRSSAGGASRAAAAAASANERSRRARAGSGGGGGGSPESSISARSFSPGRYGFNGGHAAGGSPRQLGGAGGLPGGGYGSHSPRSPQHQQQHYVTQSMPQGAMAPRSSRSPPPPPHQLGYEQQHRQHD